MGIRTLKVSHHEIIEPCEKAEVMNDHFQSVFTDENLRNFPLVDPSPYAYMPPVTISLTISGIYKLLTDLNPFKATGPDNIPACFLKETAEEVAPMLTHLFNQSLRTGEIPQDWKKAYVQYVIPVYEKELNQIQKTIDQYL